MIFLGNISISDYNEWYLIIDSDQFHAYPGKENSYMALQESGEMYLETIYVLSQKSSSVRAIDIGEYMGYSKPSVSRALGLLKDEGMVIKDEDGFIKLTEAGETIARRIYERHTVLTTLFMNLGVDEQTASEDACRIEHYISDTTFNAVKSHMLKYSS